MNVPPEFLRERLPVWEVFSEFFLDTRLEDGDHARLGLALALSPYSEEELRDIPHHEAYPACHSNLLDVAGEWAAFGDDWLIEKIAPRHGRRPGLSRPCLHRRMILDYSEKVQTLLTDFRTGSPHLEALTAGSVGFPRSDPGISTTHPR